MVQSLRMTERRTIALKPGDAPRDPARRPVRPGAARARPSAPARDAPPPGPAARAEAAAPPARPAAGRPPAAAPGRPPRSHPPFPAPEAAVAATAAAPAGVRVSKWLTEQGLASRREADAWIESGWVRVDGVPAVLGQRIDPARQSVEIDPAARQQQARLVTILLHKPLGIVSGQAEDGHAAAVSLIDPKTRWAEDRAPIRFHPGQLRHLAPAGRLDIDSTGLLVLTQDGRVAKRLIGDETRVEKEYLVRVRPLRPGPPPEDCLDRLRHGLELDGRPLKPAQASWANEDQLRIVLREGRKRQIRRMCELVGLAVVALKRVRIGRIPLGALPPGQWRYLRDDERF